MMTYAVKIRLALGTWLFLMAGALILSWLTHLPIASAKIPQPLLGFGKALGFGALVFGMVSGPLLVKIIQIEEKRSSRVTQIEQKIEIAEKKVRENPKPEAVWDLARVTLEKYVDRNLFQVQLIYWLTIVIMTCGFSLIIFGTSKAFTDPKNFNASVLSSVSGILVTFIGGTFLVLFRSTMAQAKEYVTMLERINAVGMSIQIIEGLDDGNKELRDRATADIARNLLTLYAPCGSQQS